jgi:hypothetical protein
MGLSLLIPVITITFCIVAGLMSFRNIPAALRLLILQACIALLADILGLLSIRTNLLPINQILFNIYIPLEFLLMLFAARANFGRHFRVFSLAGIICFLISYGLSMTRAGIFHLATQTIAVCAVILTITYFVVLLQNIQRESSGYTTGIYCIAVAVMLYYCCIVPYFGFMHYITEHDLRLAKQLYYINNVLSSLRYVCTGIGLLILSRSTSFTAHAYK